MSLFSTATMDSASNFRAFWAEEVKRREKKVAGPQLCAARNATMHASPISPRALAFAFMGMWHLVGCK